MRYNVWRDPMTWVLIGVGVVVIVVSILGILNARARDLDGRYAQSPLKQWFDSLQNTQGHYCCSDADGHRLEDPDWEQTEKGYRVKIAPGGPWYDVPEHALVKGTNKVGYAVVWRTIWYNGNVEINCFMPGSRS